MKTIFDVSLENFDETVEATPQDSRNTLYSYLCEIYKIPQELKKCSINQLAGFLGFLKGRHVFEGKKLSGYHNINFKFKRKVNKKFKDFNLMFQRDEEQSMIYIFFAFHSKVKKDNEKQIMKDIYKEYRRKISTVPQTFNLKYGRIRNTDNFNRYNNTESFEFKGYHISSYSSFKNKADITYNLYKDLNTKGYIVHTQSDIYRNSKLIITDYTVKPYKEKSLIVNNRNLKPYIDYIKNREIDTL